MPETDAPDLITMPTKDLKALDLPTFKAGVEAMPSKRLKKFHEMREITESQDKIVVTRLLTFGFTFPEQDGKRSSLPYYILGTVCVLMPVIGFFGYQYLVG